MVNSIGDAAVGVIGVGKMGRPMAIHMRKAAKTVYAYDLNEAALEELAKAGVRRADSIATLAAQCDVLFVVVGFDHEVSEICMGDNGLFANAREGSVIVVVSTVAPATMDVLLKAAPAGIHVIDSPLCRGEIPAEKGELLALVGASDEIFAYVLPLLQTFCSDIDHLGAAGAGQVGKAANNFLLWSCIAANYEALTMGSAYGLDSEKLRQALLKSSGCNWALETWNRPRPMPWANKDMMIVLGMADEKNIEMPLAGFIKERIKSVKKDIASTQIDKTLARPCS